MADSYAKACSQVTTILKKLPKNEYDRIPKDQIEFYDKHKDENYIVNINEIYSNKNDEVSRLTNAILITIFRDYFSNEMQKEKLKYILIQNDRRKSQNNKDNNLQQKTIINEQLKKEPVKQEVGLIEIKKESFIKKFFKNLKNMFKRK